jgi:hypothetical protein
MKNNKSQPMKNLRTLSILTILIFSFVNNISAQYPADSAEIYLITASSGSETYAAFGHSAIRVYDHTRNYDVVYNFGTFDFSTEYFYFKFGFGRLMYFLSKKQYEHFVYEYQYYGQALYLQKFNLTNKEKWQLISNLEKNYLPENRYYRYDFFYDNCATRIRDIIETSLDEKIIYDSTYVTKTETFRQLIAYDLGRTPWTFFGINILMGKGTDSIAKLRNYMFLPLHMKNIFGQSKVLRGDSIVPLTEKPVELFPTTLVFAKPQFIMLPEVIIGILFLLVLVATLWGYRNNPQFRWFDFILFLGTGLLGLLVAILTIWSMHSVLHHNANLFWANPIHLIFAFCILTNCKKKWFRYLAGVYAFILMVFVTISFFIMQDIPLAGKIVALIIATRLAGYYLYRMKK